MMMDKLVSAVVAGAFALASIVEVSAQAVTTNRAPVVIPNYTQNGGLPKWQACLARVRAGTGSCTILVMGESTPAGYGCAYQATAANYSRACSWVAQLAQTLYQEYNIATSYNAIMGGALGQPKRRRIRRL